MIQVLQFEPNEISHEVLNSFSIALDALGMHLGSIDQEYFGSPVVNYYAVYIAKEPLNKEKLHEIIFNDLKWTVEDKKNDI